jgi:cytidine deaminase
MAEGYLKDSSVLKKANRDKYELKPNHNKYYPVLSIKKKNKVCQPKSLKNKKFDLMVIRYCEDGNSTISRPCNSCLAHLKSFGMIDKVYYFNKDKEFQVEKLDDMIPQHVSRGFLSMQ